MVGKAYTHPESVSTETSRYLKGLTVGLCMKSSCRSDPGRNPLAGDWVKGDSDAQSCD